MKIYDALVVGAGPAGLTAATYLGRFRRKALIIDGGPPRASWIPESHNTPGFAEGVGGDELLARLRDQAGRYGAHIRSGRVERLETASDGFVATLAGEAVRARRVLLATGVVDKLPALPGIEAAIHASVVRICPICDAFEAIDASIAVLGEGPLGSREALFLRTYSSRVTLIHLGDGPVAEPEVLAQLGIEVIRTDVGFLTLADRSVRLDHPATGPRSFDHLYLALGCSIQSGLAGELGARHDDQGKLLVDAHQATSVEGLYAAGDVVLGLNQIAIAAAEAAIAATAVHNALRASPPTAA